MNLYVIDLTYTADLSDVDALLEAHRAYLKDHYAAGVFLVSGPKTPRTGGVILARGTGQDDIERVVDLDPFKTGGVADYTITEFSPVMRAPEFSDAL